MITAQATIQIELSGDITGNIIQSALDNAVSPAQNYPIALVAGNNTLTAPVIPGLVVTRLTIIPPSGNTSILTLAGIPIHLTDWTSIALDPTFVSAVLNSVTAIVVRVIWS